MLNKIGFFQFDNLIQNRVPFLFINLVGAGAVHLEKSTFADQEEQIFTKLESQCIPFDTAIVLLCLDGVKSTKIFNDLESKGYTNVYVIDGGYQQLMTERSST